MDGEYLEQKLSQNGFTAQDLSGQTGLDLKTIQAMIANNEGSQDDWNIVLDTLNQYPVLYYPAEEIIEDINDRISQDGDKDPCTIFYGVNQSELVFAVCQFSDGSLHGANVNTTYLHRLDPVTLAQAKELFEAQNAALANAHLQSREIRLK